MLGYSLPSPIGFVTNGDVTNIDVNPIWRYTGYHTDIYFVDYGATSGSYSRNTPSLFLHFDRLSEGIINRLALPIMLLLLLGKIRVRGSGRVGF